MWTTRLRPTSGPVSVKDRDAYAFWASQTRVTAALVPSAESGVEVMDRYWRRAPA